MTNPAMVKELPASQTELRSRCFHPSNSFIAFDDQEIEQSIASRFEKQAGRFPEQIAIKTRASELTYDDVNRLSNQIAGAILKERGEKREAVALMFESEAMMICGMLGVLKSGNFFVTLDPQFPEERITYMLSDSRADIIVTDSQHMQMAHRFSSANHKVINIDEIEPGSAAGNPNRPIRADEYAYIIYTSGSTGQPKGIVFDQRSVLFGIKNYTNSFRICQRDRLTLLHSPSFSSGIVDILCALLNGAALYPWNTRREGMTGLGEWLAKEEVTIFDWVPTPFRYFSDSLNDESRFPALRLLILASEPVYARDVELYKKYTSPGCLFVNRLGTTETYNFRLYFIGHESEVNTRQVPVGYAVPGKDVLLLDETGQEVGIDQIGEIAIKSRYMAVGYWGKPELTQKAFLPDPLGGDERIYLTKDLGIIRPDGCLEYLGRKDSQVKVRGYRIEISEIEATLNEQEFIKEAAVVTREDETGEKQLIAFYVPADGQEPSINQIRTALGQRIPDFMVPAKFVRMEVLPVTPTGKLDRNALPSDIPSEPQDHAAISAPRDTTEYQLTSLWEKVLARQAISLTDNFFELGGHSLSAMRLLTEIEKVFSQRLPQTVVYVYPTIEQMALVIREKQGIQDKPFSPILAINPGGSKPPFFCMPGIMGNIFTDLGHLSRQLGAEQPFYGLQDGLDLPAQVEAKAENFIREMRKIQPHGPYLLGGVCSGALTALEIAQQLIAKNEQVALLVVIEPAFPWKPGLRSIVDFFYNVYHRLVMRINFHTRNVSQLGIADKGSYLQLKLKLIANMWEARQYSARKYPGQIHNFSTRESLAKPAPAFKQTWENIAQAGIEKHEIPGTHNAITGDFDTTIEDAIMHEIAVILRPLIEKVTK